jgi:hypothetical protein
MLAGQVVAWLSIQIQIGVDGLLYSVHQWAIWSSVYVSIQEGKESIWLSIHGELYVLGCMLLRWLSSLRPWGQITNVSSM